VKTADRFPEIGCFFEFSPPFTSQRSDLILVSEREILVVEAKTGIHHSRLQAQKQALSYAYDIYNSLRVGTDRAVVPIVLQESTSSEMPSINKAISNQDHSPADVAVISAKQLPDCIRQMTPPTGHVDLLDTSTWMYRPRASIVSLSQEMFGNLRSGEVLKSLADNDEIDRLVTRVSELIRETRDNSEHRLIAITGRPGSGKTLVGLRIAHQITLPDPSDSESDAPIYVSGNGPLVEVLQEAIARSYKTSYDRYSESAISIEMARRVAKSHILEVRGVIAEQFRIRTNVVIFDEAQRAWNAKHMRRKHSDQTLESQPFEILKKMSEKTWAVVICLVGTGQHINAGEEGMSTWYNAVRKLSDGTSRSSSTKSTWRISVSREAQFESAESTVSPDLELTVDMRAGSTRMNEWVNLLLESKLNEARDCRNSFPDFPLLVSRDLDTVLGWLRSSTNLRHRETAGLLASSTSGRLTSYGVRVASAASDNFPAVNWYLERPPHLDSCNSFDFAATEYRCQGLELDRVGVCWSWDLLPRGGQWVPRQLNRATGRWNWVSNERKQEYRINSYRVLLTRSRLGMIIWVPRGDQDDTSRSSIESDEIYETLVIAGCDPIGSPQRIKTPHH